MADTEHNGLEDIFIGVFEIEKVFGKLDTADGTESPSTRRADKLEKENESLYKLVDKLQDDLVKKDEKHADEIKYWKKVADEFSNAGGKLEAENNGLKRLLSETRDDLNFFRDKNSSMSVENDELKDQVKRLEDWLDARTKARDRFEKENNRLNEELSEYAHKLVDAEAEIASHKKRLAELSNAVVNANAATSNIKNEYLVQIRINNKLREELEMAKDHRNEWVNYGTRLEARNTELNDKIERLQKELDDAASTNIELGKRIDDLQMNEQKLSGEKYNLAAQIGIAIEDNNRLRKSLDRTQINDEAIIPLLYKLNKAFMDSVSNNADFGGWLQAYSHFSSICDAFSEIYYIVDEKYPEEHIFELIDDFLLEARDYFGKRFAAQIKPEPKEDNAKENN